jgi:hypothetical protein
LSTLCRINLEVDIEPFVSAVRLLPPRASIAREATRLRREELDGSLAVSQTPLSTAEVRVLVDHGLAVGGHRLDAYLNVRDLAAAAAWVTDHRAFPPGDPRPLITVEDVRKLHGLVTASHPAVRPGVWRLAVDPPHKNVVSPPPWLVPKETASLVDRVRRAPSPHALGPWLADFLARFSRIRPFAGANGRTGRLAASLLLRRLDVPPLVIARRDATAYAVALLAAEAGDRAALTALVEGAIVQSCRRLIAAAGDDPLLPLRALAGPDYAALIKAAQRGRLQVVMRDRRVFSTAGWVAAYRDTRAVPTAPPA